MKKILMAMFAVALSCSAMAQTKMSDTSMNKMDHMGMQKMDNSVMMMNGKMMTMMNGKSMPMTETKTMLNGTMVMTERYCQNEKRQNYDVKRRAVCNDGR